MREEVSNIDNFDNNITNNVSSNNFYDNFDFDTSNIVITSGDEFVVNDYSNSTHMDYRIGLLENNFFNRFNSTNIPFQFQHSIDINNINIINNHFEQFLGTNSDINNNWIIDIITDTNSSDTNSSDTNSDV
jgi:hypothetical protein